MTETTTHSRVRRPDGKRAILSIDGGGMKGVLAACVLEVLEHELREQTGIPDLLIAEAFDLIVGTSTGAILASYFVAYACPGLSASKELAKSVRDGSVGNALDMYRDISPNVFPRWGKRSFLGNLFSGAKFPHLRIERALKAVFEDRVTLSALSSAESRGRPISSLLLTTYDLVNGEQGVFVADRVLGMSRFLHLDPLLLPRTTNFAGDATVADDRVDVLEAGLQTMAGQAAEGERQLFGIADDTMSLFNVGDARLEMTDAQQRPSSHTQRSGGATKIIWTSDPEVRLWQAIRCSTAAPTFWAPARIPDFWRQALPTGGEQREDLVAADGALVAQNPALFALLYQVGQDESRRKSGGILRGAPFSQGAVNALGDYAILSIGCGVVLGLDSVDKMAKQTSIIDWMTGENSLINILMNNAPAASHFLLEALYATLASKRHDPQLVKQYLRVQVRRDRASAPAARCECERATRTRGQCGLSHACARPPPIPRARARRWLWTSARNPVRRATPPLR
jgi:patatin-like phospholipase/acyl hydrolase